MRFIYRLIEYILIALLVENNLNRAVFSNNKKKNLNRAVEEIIPKETQFYQWFDWECQCHPHGAYEISKTLRIYFMLITNF